MIELIVNGRSVEVDDDPATPLLYVLRGTLALNGAKYGCGLGQCGACTVIAGSQAIFSCITPISAVGSAKVTTIEGLGDSDLGRKLQAAWIKHDVPQCGYCQAGQLMSAASLLGQNARPSDQDIDDGMSGNICRCCTYTRVRAAIKEAAGLPTTDSREV